MAEKQHTVLLVDDERDILDALYDTFIDKYEVFKANSAAEALDILKEKTKRGPSASTRSSSPHNQIYIRNSSATKSRRH